MSVCLSVLVAVFLALLFKYIFRIIIKRNGYNRKTHNLYSSPSIIRMIKSRRLRWAGHVARMGREGMCVRDWWESRKEGDHWEDKDIGEWTILKWIFEI
jgi:hypothetical protein